MIDKQIFIRYCEPKRKSIMEAVRTEKTRMIAPAAGVEDENETGLILYLKQKEE